MIAKSKRRELYSTATYVPLRGIPLDYRRPSWAFIIRPLNLTVYFRYLPWRKYEK